MKMIAIKHFKQVATFHNALISFPVRPTQLEGSHLFTTALPKKFKMCYLQKLTAVLVQDTSCVNVQLLDLTMSLNGLCSQVNLKHFDKSTNMTITLILTHQMITWLT